MNDQNYTTSITVDENPGQIYRAINNVRGWWSEEIEGPTDELNKEWFYHYRDIHLCKMKVVEMIPNEKVVWEVIENSFNFVQDQNEWVGNRLIFEISQEGDQTKLNFTQEGLTNFYECYGVCRDGWNNYINNSLYQLITTGKGEPNPKEGDGFNKALADKWKLN
ncbi:ATPase [Flavilitoribacter nigricans DSM 23189 = NBRC 102662]|uniref:ATPase n=1 Tax=Flavilitoribacter nigricans (strain ATCC 23147 / DSM 23189 / NBRC 102662 / NCIMB 1420 / SS-2) TaxID=1122177 RepID=A0A2D0N235_FLAN2|nr:ATPase [Flavilitoribacter nigricans DSM 23189 = NBRC 102662]